MENKKFIPWKIIWEYKRQKNKKKKQALKNSDFSEIDWGNFDKFCDWFNNQIRHIKDTQILNIIPVDLGKFLNLPFQSKNNKTNDNFKKISKFLKMEMKQEENLFLEYNLKNKFNYYDSNDFAERVKKTNFDFEELMVNIWDKNQKESNCFYSLYDTGILNFNYMYSINDLISNDEEKIFFKSLYILRKFHVIFKHEDILSDFSKLSDLAKLNFIKEHVNYLFLNYGEISRNEKNIDYSSLIFIKKRTSLLKFINRLKGALYSPLYVNKLKLATEKTKLKSSRKIDRLLSLSNNYPEIDYEGLSSVNTIFLDSKDSSRLGYNNFLNSSIYKKIINFEKWNEIANFKKEEKSESKTNDRITKCVANDGYIATDKKDLYSILNYDKKDKDGIKEAMTIKDFIVFYNYIQSFRALCDSIVYNLSRIQYDFYGLKNIVPVFKYYKNQVNEFHLFINDKNEFNFKKDIFDNSEIEFKLDYCISALETKFTVEDAKREKKKAINSGILQFTVLIFAGIAAYSVLYKFLGPDGKFEVPYFIYWGPFAILLVLLIAALASYLDKKR
ncbi:hypothetical protein [Mycoplasma elephantis]|uniref:hypothetical protein n=1 Tax=Mycoplasma elephantis TaxID=114882 RepID=UPI00048143C4|nr:hypothetical protein [Mycoplasma elephantis]